MRPDAPRHPTLAHFEAGQAPAGIVIDGAGDVYIARPNPMDEASRGVYRLGADRTAERPPGTEQILLANGLALDGKGHLYASDSALGAIWRISLDGSSAPESWFADASVLGGCAEGDIGVNGIALSAEGDVFALLVMQNQLVRIDPSSGSVDVLATDEDGLYNPASLAFGTAEGDTQNLYLVNYALLPPAFDASLGPAVLKLDVGVEGRPLS